LPIGFTMRNQLTHELGFKRELFQKLWEKVAGAI
jgi:hypothetical protein